MIAISAPTFDIAGSVVLRHTAKSDLGSLTRRVSRTATLDGGATVTDMGFSHADRILRITGSRVSRTEYDAIAYLLETYGTLIVATPVELFLAVPQGMPSPNDTLTVTLLVIEKLA